MSKVKMELDMTNSIVRLTVSCNKIDVSEPWRTNKKEEEITGFVIELNQERFILTNSTKLINVAYITASFMDEPLPLKVDVAAIDYMCDLALLKCSAPEFLNKAVPLDFASALPDFKSNGKVTIHEFSKKNQYSSTPGNITLIDTCIYSDDYDFLNLKIGSSSLQFSYGGPLIHENKVIGVMNGSRAIPLPVISHFLTYPSGFPQIPFSVQILEHAKTREALGLDKNQGGLLVLKIFADSDSSPIKSGDVVIEIDDNPFKVDGTIKHPHSQNLISYTHLLRMHALGDELKLKIIREGNEITCMIKLQLTLGKPYAVKNYFDEKLSTYFAAHGLVFSPLTQNYITAMKEISKKNGWDRARMIPKFLQTLLALENTMKTSETGKIFVISKILTCEHTVGVDSLIYSVIKTINGQIIKNMRHLMEILSTKPDDDVHTIITNDNWQIVLPHLDYQQNLDLLNKSGISAQAPHSLLEKHGKNAKRKREETELEVEEQDKKRLKTADNVNLLFAPAKDIKETPSNIVDTNCQLK